MKERFSLGKDAADLRTSHTVRVSFGKAGFVFIDPAKSFPGLPSKAIPSIEGSYLNFVYVRPDYRGKGIGKIMLRKIMEHYPVLWGIAGSPEGAALMQKCGVRYV